MKAPSSECLVETQDRSALRRRSSQGGKRAGLVARRGMAVLLVLGLLALTLTLSYAMLRMEYQVQQSQTNISGQDQARLAALTGVSIALRQMHDGTWTGVGSTLQGTVVNGVSYDVSFQTGDPTLTSSHAKYGEYPYRVTLSSTGVSVDPAQPLAQSTYQVTAVAELARRNVNASSIPNRWSQLNNYTVYQWNSSSTPRDVAIELPCQIQGSAYFEGTLRLAQAYPKTSNSRERYLKDLMLLAERGTDYRPFTGTVYLDQSRQSGSTLNDLSSWLGVTVSAINGNSSHPVPYPAGVTTYQLYPGGKVYTIPRLQDVLVVPAKNQLLIPDPVNNPLGVFRSDGSWTFMTGSKLTGTLLCESPTAVITLAGSGEQLAGFNLPHLEGSSTAYQLPTSMVRNDVVATASPTINGLVIAWNQFIVNPGPKATQVTLTGRVFSDGFQIYGRNEWNALTQDQWQQSLSDFEAQYNPLLFLLGSEEFYPRWLERSPYYLYAAPRLKFTPPSSVTYHWPDFSKPIYAKADSDVGLRWNLVSWTESAP